MSVRIVTTLGARGARIRPSRLAHQLTLALPLLLVVSLGCTPTTVVAPSPSQSSGASEAGVSVAPSSASGAAPDWRSDPDEPYPFVQPVPAYLPTTVDGIYTREPTDRYVGHRAPCRRCPPYPEDRGVSSLTLRAGRYLVRHSRPEYQSLGHFRIVGDRIELFNDIECSHVAGSYRWRLEDATLLLSDPQDPCGFGQREKDLTALPWRITGAAAGRIECQPPNEEAAVTGHWSMPSDC